jgi:hypothetical protein
MPPREFVRRGALVRKLKHVKSSKPWLAYLAESDRLAVQVSEHQKHDVETQSCGAKWKLDGAATATAWLGRTGAKMRSRALASDW